jgi:hypothetical protein
MIDLDNKNNRFHRNLIVILSKYIPSVKLLIRYRVVYRLIVADIFDMGIYCKSIHDRDGTVTYRTPQQDGWNDAVIQAGKIIAKRLHQNFELRKRLKS